MATTPKFMQKCDKITITTPSITIWHITECTPELADESILTRPGSSGYPFPLVGDKVRSITFSTNDVADVATLVKDMRVSGVKAEFPAAELSSAAGSAPALQSAEKLTVEFTNAFVEEISISPDGRLMQATVKLTCCLGTDGTKGAKNGDFAIA